MRPIRIIMVTRVIRSLISSQRLPRRQQRNSARGTPVMPLAPVRASTQLPVTRERPLAELLSAPSEPSLVPFFENTIGFSTNAVVT